MKILTVLTSHSELGNTGKKTGFWIEKFAATYYVFADAGAIKTIASPAGGQPPIDPKRKAANAQIPATERLYKDDETIYKVAYSLKLCDIKAEDFYDVFYSGGHSPLWNLPNRDNFIKLTEDFYSTKKSLAFVCHAPAALVKVKLKNGDSLVQGKILHPRKLLQNCL